MRTVFGFRQPAFSLIEILVVVALLSIIVLGLLAMFSQTQRAFRVSLTQADILSSARLVSDQLSRELEQITPAYQPGTNFYTEIPYAAGVYTTPFVLPLPGSGSQNWRTNLIQDLFFVTKRNQDWVATGYFVRANNPSTGDLFLSPLGIGNLYRFEMTVSSLSGLTVSNLFNAFTFARLNENRATKLAEGVLHFKVRAFDPSGTWIVTNILQNIGVEYNNYKPAAVAGQPEVYKFTSNAVPGAVEVEFGILEDKTWQRFKAQAAIAQYKYLTNQAGRVHVFRQRVAVRDLDPIAYP